MYFTDICPRPKFVSTLDLSLGGTKIETPYTLVKGERLGISVVIPRWAVRCRGGVVYILKENGEMSKAGIRFEDLSKLDRFHLREYISGIIEQMQGKRLHVRNLNFSVTNKQLEELFSNYGVVRGVKIIEGRGFGFVEMSNQSEAKRAKEALDYVDFKGRVLRVDETRPLRIGEERDYTKY